MAKQHSERLDKAFAALADPTRRAMVERLSQGQASVSELAEPFSISLPAVSKHLGVLEEAGLIARRKDGRVRNSELRMSRSVASPTFAKVVRAPRSKPVDQCQRLARANRAEAARHRPRASRPEIRAPLD
jgi:DNA-binding transcriptional ArsR family regulator